VNITAVGDDRGRVGVGRRPPVAGVLRRRAVLEFGILPVSAARNPTTKMFERRRSFSTEESVASRATTERDLSFFVARRGSFIFFVHHRATTKKRRYRFDTDRKRDREREREQKKDKSQRNEVRSDATGSVAIPLVVVIVAVVVVALVVVLRPVQFGRVCRIPFGLPTNGFNVRLVCG